MSKSTIVDYFGRRPKNGKNSTLPKWWFIFCIDATKYPENEQLGGCHSNMDYLFENKDRIVVFDPRSAWMPLVHCLIFWQKPKYRFLVRVDNWAS